MISRRARRTTAWRSHSSILGLPKKKKGLGPLEVWIILTHQKKQKTGDNTIKSWDLGSWGWRPGDFTRDFGVFHQTEIQPARQWNFSGLQPKLRIGWFEQEESRIWIESTNNCGVCARKRGTWTWFKAITYHMGSCISPRQNCMQTKSELPNRSGGLAKKLGLVRQTGIYPKSGLMFAQKIGPLQQVFSLAHLPSSVHTGRPFSTVFFLLPSTWSQLQSQLPLALENLKQTHGK